MGTFVAGWIIFLSAVFNFIFGALLPIIPKLSLEKAGLAFTLFYFFKAACLAPAGWITDRLGHLAGLSVAAFFQCLALLGLILFPENPWIGRIFEGIALAQGTVSAISYLRLLSESPEKFAKRMKALMSISGVGFVFGPMAAYSMSGMGTAFVLNGLLGVMVLCFVFQLSLQFRLSRAGFAAPDAAVSNPNAPVEKMGAVFVWTLVGFAGAKAVSVGWQPIIAWWVTDVFFFNPLTAGLSFLVLGIALSLGSAKPFVKIFWIFGPIGFLLMERALRYPSMLWWISLGIVGYWWGSYVSIAFGKLGWGDSRSIGKWNSLWLFAAEIPTALVPAVIWPWRDPWDIRRLVLGCALIFASVLGYWFGIRKSSRA